MTSVIRDSRASLEVNQSNEMKTCRKVFLNVYIITNTHALPADNAETASVTNVVIVTFSLLVENVYYAVRSRTSVHGR